LKAESELSFITNPSRFDNEEHRTNYVGFSRAKENLFINVPSLIPLNAVLVATHFDVIEL